MKTWIHLGDKVRVTQDGLTVAGKIIKAGPDCVDVHTESDEVVAFPWQDMMGMSGSYDDDDPLLGHPYYEFWQGDIELVTSWKGRD